MKNQNQNDLVTRKSIRQRTPNSFYTEAINQLKKNTKIPKEVNAKPNRKKSKMYDENSSNSFNEELIQNYRNNDSKQHRNWYHCKLPKSGNSIKVQFIFNQTLQYVPEKKKEEQLQAPISTKGNQSSFDLLSLFKKAIQNVNNEDEENDKQIQVEQNKDLKIKKETGLTKLRKGDENEGKILEVRWNQGKLVLRHNIMGESEYNIVGQKVPLNNSMNSRQVNYFRQKLMNSNYLRQISILS